MAGGPLHVVITDCDLGPVEAERRILTEHLGPEVEVTVADCRTEADVLAAAADADALIVQWAPVTQRVIDAMSQCRVISRYGIGVDMIDVDAAAERGIAVRNVPHYCVDEVATHATAMLLALSRRLPMLDASVRAGTWDAPALMHGVQRITSSTLGLVGVGRIGSAVAAPFRALGATVIAYDPYSPEIEGIEFVGLDELFARADLISLHCPLTEQTRHIVNDKTLANLAPNAVLVNTARGALIDLPALGEALTNGSLAAAGLDVFDGEPLAADDPIRSVPNVLLSPHAAWCSQQALPALQASAAWNVVAFFHPELEQPELLASHEE